VRSFAGRRVTIVGLAREGTALARFLAAQGATVTVTDRQSAEALAENVAALAGWPIRFVLGEHPLELLDTDVVFVSPGVPLEIPLLVEARRRGVPLSSETRLFVELCPAPIVGITGSSGKTTTTTLVGEILRASGQTTWVGGNIGFPLIEHLAEIAPTDRVVMELSSFQLEFFAPWAGEEGRGISPAIAAVLNISPNHLDRHPSMEAYIAAKKQILLHQRADDVAVLGLDNAEACALAGECRGQVLFFSQREAVEQGAFLRDEVVTLRLGQEEQAVCAVSEIRLLGRHNVDNVLAACALAGVAGADVRAMAAVATTFSGVEHRLELVRELNGVRWYNDSIATSPERMVAALRAFDAPIVLLAGGRDKHLPWDEAAELILRKVRHLVLFGEAVPIIERAMAAARSKAAMGRGPEVTSVSTLEEAVVVAARVSRPGDVVLLAPGCTSFDAFKDFAARGERFRELVKQLEQDVDS
jgi:UDP-N-acetylmuramoylalanine--D-glutamate ligase